MSSPISQLSEDTNSLLNENASDPAVSSVLPASAGEPPKVSAPIKSETHPKSESYKRPSRQSTTIQSSTHIVENGSTHAKVIRNRSKMNGNEKQKQAEESVTKDKDNKVRLELKTLVNKWVDELVSILKIENFLNPAPTLLALSILTLRVGSST
jgi:hypothetical protein